MIEPEVSSTLVNLEAVVESPDTTETNNSFIDPLFKCENRYNLLQDEELADRQERSKAVEAYFSASVVKGAGLVAFKESNKPTIIIKNNDQYLSALLDSGSEKCLISYKQVKNLNEEVKPSRLMVKGINGKSNVSGEVELSINIPGTKKVLKTNALIVKEAKFNYDLILGRDVLKDAIINFKNRTLHWEGISIPFSEL